MRFFSKDLYKNMMGEMTIHAFKREWGEDLGRICISLNDGTLLFSNLGSRTKARWMTAVSSLYTEKRYHYSDNFGHFDLRGQISLIINIATPSYKYYKGELDRTTLNNRLMRIHAWLHKQERHECKRKYSATKKLKPTVKIEKIYPLRIKNISDYEGEIRTYADLYSALAVRHPDEVEDLLKGAIKAQCNINHRNYMGEDEIKLIKTLKPYMVDPIVKDYSRIVELLKLEKSYRDICILLKKPLDYKSTISKVRTRARTTGALD